MKFFLFQSNHQNKYRFHSKFYTFSHFSDVVQRKRNQTEVSITFYYFLSLVICKKVLFLFTKKNKHEISLNMRKYFLLSQSKNDVKVVAVNLAK